MVILMMQIVALLLSALPFVLCLYALHLLEQGRNDDRDDPPPPDANPPEPVEPVPASPHRRVPTDDRSPTADRSPRPSRGPSIPRRQTPSPRE